MRKYHYAALPVDDVIDASIVCTQPDSYIAKEPGQDAVIDILKKGYRWVNTVGGYAIFEKALHEFPQDVINMLESNDKAHR